MGEGSLREISGWGSLRRAAFFVWAALLSLLFGVTFVGLTGLTVGLWLADRNTDTNPVVDLGFFALGAVIVATGFAVQLRRPERRISGLQQAAIGLLALGVAGLIGRRVEPFAGSLIALGATAILAALHPARRELFRLGTHPSLRLAALPALAAIPATVYAAAMLVRARQAGPSCFFGQCAYGDRFAEAAALAIAVVVAGMLAAFKPGGWRITARSVGVSAAILGAASIMLPGLHGSLGGTGGAVAVAWGLLFVVVAEREARRVEEPPGVKRKGRDASGS